MPVKKNIAGSVVLKEPHQDKSLVSRRQFDSIQIVRKKGGVPFKSKSCATGETVSSVGKALLLNYHPGTRGKYYVVFVCCSISVPGSEDLKTPKEESPFGA